MLQYFPKLSIESIGFILLGLAIASSGITNKIGEGENIASTVMLLMIRALPIMSLYFTAYSQFTFASPYIKFVKQK